MTRIDWLIKVLSESAKEELAKVYRLWLFENHIDKNIRVSVNDCLCNELEWTDQYKKEGLIFVQEERTALNRDFIDSSKPALVLIPKFYDANVSYYLVYWYNPNIEISKNNSNDEKLRCKIKHLDLPTFEEWKLNNNEATIQHGAYRVEIRAFCWGKGYAQYGFAMSLSNCNALNVFTNKLFSSFFEHYGDAIKLKQWYDSTVVTFNDFWEEYINELYIETKE